MMDNSSDSSDTIILSHDNLDVLSDTEVENILKKYSSTSGSTDSKPSSSTYSLNKCYDLDEFSDEDVIDEPAVKKARTSSNRNNLKETTGQTSSSEDLLKNLQNKYFSSGSSKDRNSAEPVVILSDSSDSDSACDDSQTSNKCPFNRGEDMGTDILSRPVNDEYEELKEVSPKTAAKIRKQRELETKRRDKAKEKEKKQEETKKRKAIKDLEKEKKKEMLEQQKAIKNAVKDIERSIKPDECIKYMMVEIDNEISQKEYGPVLKETLKDNNISFKSVSQIFPNLISWCRKKQTIEDMFLKSTEVNEKHLLLIMDMQELSNLARSNSLTLHIQEIVSITQCKQLTLAVFGADRPKGDQDFAIIEAQMFTKCYFRFAKKSEDLATIIMELTKAIAQIPYKLKKQEKYMLQTEYFNDSNKDTVRVDKNGNGLSRLWHQMLTMFPLARLETAEAITAVYPTPSSLFEAYDNCPQKKEEMLQNLPIRRAIGPCTSVRRIGPELSRKCYNFFCSTENVLI